MIIYIYCKSTIYICIWCEPKPSHCICKFSRWDEVTLIYINISKSRFLYLKVKSLFMQPGYTYISLHRFTSRYVLISILIFTCIYICICFPCIYACSLTFVLTIIGPLRNHHCSRSQHFPITIANLYEPRSHFIRSPKSLLTTALPS